MKHYGTIVEKQQKQACRAACGKTTKAGLQGQIVKKQQKQACRAACGKTTKVNFFWLSWFLSSEVPTKGQTLISFITQICIIINQYIFEIYAICFKMPKKLKIQQIKVSNIVIFK